MTDYDALRHIATFCGDCSCGCPQLLVNDTAIPERRIVITDDFGQRIEMSTDQLRDLVADIGGGVLDTLSPRPPPELHPSRRSRLDPGSRWVPCRRASRR